MKITRIEIYPVTIPYKKPNSVREGRFTPAGHHVILKVFTDQGVVGLGEATTGASSQKAFQARDLAELQHYFAPILIGQDPFNVEKIVADLEIQTTGERNTLSPTAASAVLDSLYDIMGKATNLPAYNFLGGAVRKTAGLARTIRVGAPEEMAEDALNFKEQGYKMLTIKVGEGPSLDIPRVATVRKAVGDDFPLEVDASGGFTAKEAIWALKRLQEYNIKNVEQPCLGKDLDGMAEVAAAVDVAVIADESAVTVADVMEIARKKAADIICLKPAKSGGVYICKKMAAVAEAAGLRCSIGSRHPFGVGAGAILHLVASTPCARPPLGYGSPLERLVDDIIVDPIVVENGEVHVPEGPGMGVVLDEQKLKKYSVASPIVVAA